MNSNNGLNLPKSSPKDVFMHLLAMVTLYASAVSFGVLLFQYIELSFPDPLTDFYSRSSSAIRWALASLVIIFPAYFWLAWTLAREMTREPLKQEVKTRKWLLYFTLFAAAVVIIGDLVTLIFNFLNGDLSARFVLKVLAVLFIALAVFVYYLWNLRKGAAALSDPRMRWFVFSVTALVVAAVVYGFFAAGSPFAERLRRFDDRRVANLQEIQWQVINFWQRKDKLPGKLGDLRDDISGFVPPSDPETALTYDYRVLGNLKFELCADFKTESRESRGRGRYYAPQPVSLGGQADNWQHGIGRACFGRTIDPELYALKERKPQ